MSEPARKVPEPQPKPVRLADMIYEITMEAHHIRHVQAVMGMPPAKRDPDPKELRRAEVFDATARLLERIQPVLGPVIELVKSASTKQQGGRNGGTGGEV